MLYLAKTRQKSFFDFKSFNNSVHKRNLTIRDRFILEMNRQARLTQEQRLVRRAIDTLNRFQTNNPVISQAYHRFIQLDSRICTELRHSEREVRRLSLLQSVTRYDNNGNNISNGRNNGSNNNTNNNSENNASNASNSNTNSNTNSNNISYLNNSNNWYINNYTVKNIIIFSFLVIALVITIFVLYSLGLPLEIIPVF
jgi:hypothetical protein